MSEWQGTEFARLTYWVKRGLDDECQRDCGIVDSCGLCLAPMVACARCPQGESAAAPLVAEARQKDSAREENAFRVSLWGARLVSRASPMRGPPYGRRGRLRRVLTPPGRGLVRITSKLNEILILKQSPVLFGQILRFACTFAYAGEQVF